MTEPQDLSFGDHRRDAADQRMVYPVLSRRAGGLSVGVNLNLGQECNWACVYCEVKGLTRGAPAPIDLAQLEQELDEVLGEAAKGRWSGAPEQAGAPASIKDLSIAGDGEPTLSPQFAQAVEVCVRARQRHGLEETASLVVITNGSRLQDPEVQAGVDRLHRAGGELWFKLDGGTAATRALVNGTPIPDARIEANLRRAARSCRTVVQCMVLSVDGRGPTDEDLKGRIEIIQRAAAAGAPPAGVVVYGLARPSHQPGAKRLAALPRDRMAVVGERFRVLDLPLRVVQ